MKLQDEISAIMRGRFLEIARVDNLEPMAIGQLMEIIDRHAFALWGFENAYQKQLEEGILRALVGKPMQALQSKSYVDLIADNVNAGLLPTYLQSVRAKIEENRANIPPDQWLPIQGFLDRQFPVVQDVKKEYNE